MLKRTGGNLAHKLRCGHCGEGLPDRSHDHVCSKISGILPPSIADNYRVISGGAYDGGMTIKNSSGEQIELKKFNIIAEIEKLLGSLVGFSFTCNDHKLCYAEIREYVKEKDDNFFSEEDKKACIDSNKIYELRWYPDSPIGSYCICAPSPERILEILKQEENG